MTHNIGEGERIIRAICGIAVLAIAMYYTSWWGIVGIEIALTAVVGWSPFYKLFNISTYSRRGHAASL